MGDMTKYIVTLERTESATITVEADNEAAAREQAVRQIESAPCIADITDDGEWDSGGEQICIASVIPSPLD
jgi:hypothetical protein